MSDCSWHYRRHLPIGVRYQITYCAAGCGHHRVYHPAVSFAAYAAAATAHLCDAAGFHDGHNPWERLVSAVISSFICAGIQFALSMVRPGALGFGDTTATWLITLAVGWLGWTAAVWWWTVLGILGLAGLGAMKLITQARKAQPHSIDTKAKTGGLPFVPFITLSAVIVTAAYAAGIPL